MKLGEKLRQARLEAGLSQRALCAGALTRNMLSLIENGSARPSMKTLSLLAQRLGKPVSYFLEEEGAFSPNAQVMEQARSAFDAGNYSQAVEALAAFSQPDAVYDRERDLIWALSHLSLAQAALDRGQAPYALALLQKGEIPTAYESQSIRRKRLLLLGQMGQRVSKALPSLDGELLLRAGEALEDGQWERARALLEAAEDRQTPQWNFLRGKLWLHQGQYAQAALCLGKAEAVFPREVIGLLEQCYREMGDYKMAYEYACKRR